ncbi:MAG: ATP-binding cassette domain-containing protein [Actinomycetes bacterium]
MAVIEVRGARKSYRRRRHPAERALDGLDLVVEAGGVHGFLGSNGSGKTTTIRILLGLVRADAGRVRLLGRDVPAGLPDVLGDVGTLVETPVFFPTFSGRRNLQVLALTAGVAPTRVEECLELVGLRERAADLVKGYSLGMRQRLGIAAALLKAPALLILDEPSNGLDPAGIVAMRELVRSLAGDGQTTVFLSSHLLSEIAQVADHVTILARGRCVTTGAVRDVLAAGGSGDVRVRLADPAAGRAVLESAGMTVSPLGDAWRVHAVPDPAQITRVLAETGQYVSELTPIEADLETVFLQLTQDQP